MNEAPHLLEALFPGVTFWRISGFVGAAAGLSALLWMSPLSPTALGQADAALGMGGAVAAAARYDAVASLNPLPWIREEALYRGAMVWAVDLGNPREARIRLEELVANDPGLSNLADIEEQIGHLAGDGEPVAAGEAYLSAYRADPLAPRAAERLMLAAKARSDAGDLAGATRLWTDIGEFFPEERVASSVARAQLALEGGDATAALELFEKAKPEDPADVGIVNLGIATCLERLGNLDGAVAGIDGSDLPADVKDARTGRMKARKQATGDL